MILTWGGKTMSLNIYQKDTLFERLYYYLGKSFNGKEFSVSPAHQITAFHHFRSFPELFFKYLKTTISIPFVGQICKVITGHQQVAGR